MEQEPKYPRVTVSLPETQAFDEILEAVVTEAWRKGVPFKEIQTFIDEARSNDYHHFIETCCRWFHVE